MSTESREALIEAYFDVLDTEDYDCLYDVFDEDVVYLYPGGEDLEGLDVAMEYFEERRPTEDSEHNLERTVHTDEVSVSEGSFTGFVPGSGPIEADFCNVFEFTPSDDRITYNGVYMRPKERGF